MAKLCYVEGEYRDALGKPPCCLVYLLWFILCSKYYFINIKNFIDCMHEVIVDLILN